MSIITEKHYVNIISPQLEKFKRESDNVFNFRCPICGDSTRDKHKARGYILKNSKKQKLFFKCHNCNAGMDFSYFLKTVFPAVFEKFRVEVWKEKQLINPKKVDWTPPKKKAPIFKKNILDSLIKISDLDHSHIAYKYLADRLIPIERFDDLYYTPKFKKWVNEWQPEKFNHPDDLDERIVIPFRDKDNKISAIQGRSLDPDIDKRFKYFTIRNCEDKKPLYGVDKIDFDKQVYVVEGPFDSMFVDNCIATANSALLIPQTLLDMMKMKPIYGWDCEPYNTEIRKMVQKAIYKQKIVSLWNFNDAKDLNEVRLLDDDINITKLLHDNKYSGLKAQLQFNNWKTK